MRKTIRYLLVNNYNIIVILWKWVVCNLNIDRYKIISVNYKFNIKFAHVAS